MALMERILEQWNFGIGDEADCLKNGHPVQLPHTWNVEDGTEEYWGNGWYETDFEVPEEWRDKRLTLYFGAAYHTAAVYVNGRQIGCHTGSGYTPFSYEITEQIKVGEKNVVTVCVNNAFTDQILPCRRSFDWANDGGLIRQVKLQVTGRSFLTNIRVTAQPVLLNYGMRQDAGHGVFSVSAECNTDFRRREELQVQWKLFEGCDGKEQLIAEGKTVLPGQSEKRVPIIPGQVLENVKYWHFDRPALYTLRAELKAGETTEDHAETVFGFRKFEVKGKRFCLNGEFVRLTGTEWMPGSDPRYGMAEPKEQLEKMLACLKNTNCVLTRFHWQQDDAVYDWCDRHGMLVQEEVPFWGKDPELAGEKQLELFKQQMAEMVNAHRNHPSIISWGVGNELAGQSDQTIQYIKDAVAYTHLLDMERAANYVSNSMFVDAARDGSTDGDVLMVNDYIGTWHGDLDQYGEWDKITRQNPDRAMIPSEFGLCEPAFSGGDERRQRIFEEKMQCYRKYPNIAGTIYFCLNDYRTQMGEDGTGKLRKRVHGSTGLYGEPKPSYYAVQKECAPLVVENIGKDSITIANRMDLPCYTVDGYELTVCVGGNRYLLPRLRPGETCTVAVQEQVEKIRIFRETGAQVLS